MHEFFRSFEYDAATFDSSEHEQYVYDPEIVDSYIDRHDQQGKQHFAIMYGEAVIGDIYLKNINAVNRTCEIGIHLINDSVKGKGYGTAAMKQMLKYIAERTEITTVFADSHITNLKSCKMLENAGFIKESTDHGKVYYRFSVTGTED